MEHISTYRLMLSIYINPFDLPPKIEDKIIRLGLSKIQIINLIGLISVLWVALSPLDESILDKALQATHAIKEIRTTILLGKVSQMEDLLR